MKNYIELVLYTRNPWARDQKNKVSGNNIKKTGRKLPSAVKRIIKAFKFKT